MNETDHTSSPAYLYRYVILMKKPAICSLAKRVNNNLSMIHIHPISVSPSRLSGPLLY